MILHFAYYQLSEMQELNISGEMDNCRQKSDSRKLINTTYTSYEHRAGN